MKKSEILAWCWQAFLALLVVGCGGGSSKQDGPLPEFDVSVVAPQNTTQGLPAQWQQGPFMQIFVRSYQDSDGDGVGDLGGLISRLDYLQDLGVKGLWLMPVFPSQDHDHGYAVTDYRSIAPEYGSLTQFKQLLDQAHARGMGVVLDYVMNHSAAQHPAFIQSRSSVSNAYRDWYVWQSSAPTGWSIYGANPWHASLNGSYFAAFWDQMPEFNLRRTDVLQWHQDNLRFWLNMGVDGFRFDAVGNLVENGPHAWESQPENHLIMKSIADMLGGYASRYMVCEAPAAPLAFAAASSCGSAFAFGYQYDLVSAAKADVASIDRVATYWNNAPAGLAGFASNHDGFAGQRLADQLNGDPEAMRLAAATYLLQSNRAFIYYGEEIGMRGAATLQGDPKLRTPMSWTSDTQRAGFTSGTPYRTLSSNVASANVADQLGQPQALLTFYQQLLALKTRWASLLSGNYRSGTRSGSGFAFEKTASGQSAVVMYNYGQSALALDMTGLPALTNYVQRWPLSEEGVIRATDTVGVLSVQVPARSFVVFVRD